jgi:uncharacterized surface protein with fasciclin (FAS1) repeats
MKTSKTSRLFALCAAVTLFAAVPALANNKGVETVLRSYGDTSLFYQALINSGVDNELREDQSYTVFAPTNAAFADINPQTYPCFYSVQCHPQLAQFVREHIIAGRHPLDDLTTYGAGIGTLANTGLHIDETYVGQYAVNDRAILSTGDSGGSIVYRIDGVLAAPQDMSAFTAVSYVPSGAVTTRRTVTTTTYVAPPPAVLIDPATGIAVPPTLVVPGGGVERTTVVHTYQGQ